MQKLGIDDSDSEEKARKYLANEKKSFLSKGTIVIRTGADGKELIFWAKSMDIYLRPDNEQSLETDLSMTPAEQAYDKALVLLRAYGPTWTPEQLSPLLEVLRRHSEVVNPSHTENKKDAFGINGDLPNGVPGDSIQDNALGSEVEGGPGFAVATDKNKDLSQKQPDGKSTPGNGVLHGPLTPTIQKDPQAMAFPTRSTTPPTSPLPQNENASVHTHAASQIPSTTPPPSPLSQSQEQNTGTQDAESQRPTKDCSRPWSFHIMYFDE